MAADEGRVEPLERGHARAVRAAHGKLHAVEAIGEVFHQVHRVVLRVRGLGERAHVAQHLAERVRIQREHLRGGIEPLRDGADVVLGDGAHGAERLGDDQVRLQVLQLALVELVDRAALLGELAYRAVDLRGLEPRPDHVARDLG